jgi:outer membrane protein assembly factor BamB
LDSNGNRTLKLNALRLRDGQLRHQPLTLAASMVNSAGETIRLNPVQKQRAALLLVPLRGKAAAPNHKMLYVAFTGAEEMPQGATPATVNHGWVLAIDVTRWQQAASWNVTPSSFGGGIWQGAQGPAADEDGNVYVLTGNGGWLSTAGGIQDFNGKTDFSESFVRLLFKPGPPSSLTVADWFSPFLDSRRHNFSAAEVAPFPKGYDYTDQDISSSGAMLPPGTTLLLGGGKDGVLYVLDRTHLGQVMGDYRALKAPPQFVTWVPDASIPSYGNASPTGNLDFRPAVGVKTHHLHGTPVFWNSAQHGPMLFVWGENERLRAWGLSAAGALTPLAHGAEFASAALASATSQNLGGMPGGMLTLSANGDHGGIVWATAPVDQDANRAPVPGVVRAYDAENFDTVNRNADGTPRLRLLWSAAGFTYSKFCPPIVADGQLFVPTYDGRIDVYGP